jgi:hypothetical protein
MNGYLTFLQSLSEYQQRAEIAHLAFTERWSGLSLEEDLLKMPAVAAFSESLGVDVNSWKLELRHYAEEPDVIGTPVFDADQCKAPFNLRYYPVGVFRSHEDLVVSGMIQVADNQRALIGRLGASSTREISCARAWLAAEGIDPDTLDTVGHDAELARKMPYLDYLQALLPQQRREAIFNLAELAWGDGHEQPVGFFDHPKLAPELQRLGIPELGISDRCHVVGPVEFDGGRCTAPIWYPLFGDGKYSNYEEGGLGYCVEVHILAGIGNKPGGGGDIWVEDLWSRIVSIDDDQPEADPPESSIPLLVP